MHLQVHCIVPKLNLQICLNLHRGTYFSACQYICSDIIKTQKIFRLYRDCTVTFICVLTGASATNRTMFAYLSGTGTCIMLVPIAAYQ
jgi:hypothetical protein